MRQLLRDQLDWDTYYSHNTGDEHANRISGDEYDINALRIKSGLAPIENLSATEYASDHDGYVFVRPDRARGLCGYLLAKLGERGNYTVDDLLVNEEYRGKGIGRFMLGKLVSKHQLAMNGTVMGPNQITINAELAAQRPELTSWISSRGFHQAPGSDQQILFLPGQHIDNIPVAQLEEAKNGMPDDWCGYLGFFDGENETSWLEVFRDGAYVGSVAQNTIDSLVTRDSGLEIWNTYDFTFASGETVSASFTSERFAVIGMLNT